MQPVLNLWRKGVVRPAHRAGDTLALDPWDSPARLSAQIVAWVETHPRGWILAEGSAVAVLVHLAASRPDLGIAGVALVAPLDWTSLHGVLELSDAPLPFPAVVFPQDPSGQVVLLRERRLAMAWHARIGGAMPGRGPLASPLVQQMMAESDKLLRTFG